MGPHDIGWAVNALKRGHTVRRPHWGEGFFVQQTNVRVGTFHIDRGPQDHSVDVLLISMPSLGRVQPFTIHHDDLLATDWELA